MYIHTSMHTYSTYMRTGSPHQALRTQHSTLLLSFLAVAVVLLPQHVTGEVTFSEIPLITK